MLSIHLSQMCGHVICALISKALMVTYSLVSHIVAMFYICWSYNFVGLYPYILLVPHYKYNVGLTDSTNIIYALTSQSTVYVLW